MKRPLLVLTAWVAALVVASAQPPLSQAPPRGSHPQAALPLILPRSGSTKTSRRSPSASSAVAVRRSERACSPRVERACGIAVIRGSTVALPRYQETAAGERAIEGFEVTYVRPSGAAERLGFRIGDVILDVNGQILDGMATVMRLFDEVPAMGQATITMLRDDQRMSVVLRTK